MWGWENTDTPVNMYFWETAMQPPVHIERKLIDVVDTQWSFFLCVVTSIKILLMIYRHQIGMQQVAYAELVTLNQIIVPHGQYEI